MSGHPSSHLAQARTHACSVSCCCLYCFLSFFQSEIEPRALWVPTELPTLCQLNPSPSPNPNLKPDPSTYPSPSPNPKPSPSPKFNPNPNPAPAPNPNLDLDPTPCPWPLKLSFYSTLAGLVLTLWKPVSIQFGRDWMAVTSLSFSVDIS